MLTTAAVWSLVEEGALSFSDRVADHLPEFAAHGKGEITLFEVTTHQGGFPSADVSRESWADHARMRAEVCDFRPEWPAGTRLHYHARAAHLTLAMVIEAVTGRDYREVIRERVIAPLGIGDELYVGVPDEAQHRCADTLGPDSEPPRDNSAEMRAAGLPSGGGFAHRAGDGGVLPDDAARRPNSARCACSRRGMVEYRDAQLHRRPARRGDDRHPDASRPRAPFARHRDRASAASGSMRIPRPSAMAAPAPPIPGPTRFAACRSAT